MAEISVVEVARVPTNDKNVGRLIGIKADGTEVVISRFEGFVSVSVQEEKESEE